MARGRGQAVAAGTEAAREDELTSLKTWVERRVNEELQKMAAAMAPSEPALPPLQEGQCPHYREHNLNCGQAADHDGPCGNTGPFATED